jgi:glucose 1-dehydrogenase
MSVAGKVALVTGAGTGIGQGIAIELARSGAKVAIHYNQSNSGALRTQESIEPAGGSTMLVQANVAEKTEIDRMVQQVAERWSGIDILVNNAALQLNIPLLEYEEADFDRVMNVNLKGYWQCMQAVVPFMQAQRSGKIILISSVHGKRPTDFDPVYAMTKGGIRMLAREAAIELAHHGITVNTIEPGAVSVDRLNARDSRPFFTPEELELHKQMQRPVTEKFPLGRVGQPHDVAKLVRFIASDDNAFMNGAAIRLDGGSMLL